MLDNFIMSEKVMSHHNEEAVREHIARNEDEVCKSRHPSIGKTLICLD
jgi:hypothetical protein